MNKNTKFAKINTSIPGPKSLEVFNKEQKHLSPGLQGFALMSKLTMKTGSGSLLNDVDGNTFIDLIGGIGVNSLGHTHPEYVAALKNQVEELTVGSFTSDARAEFIDNLGEVLPKPLNRIQLYSSGAEAVESAIRLAKSYTKKYEVLGFWGGFHGKTIGTMSLMGNESKHGLGPFVSGMSLAPYADCYRCPFNMEYGKCGLFCAEFVRKHIKATGAGSLAAIIMEPMQGTAGNIVPPVEWVKAIKDIAKENNALFISDEMITGFGRSGKMWASEGWSNVIPDIMTIGKGFGAGFPVSGIISTDEITSAKPFSQPSGSSSSYGGNALAAMAANVTLKIILREKLCDNSLKVGNVMLERMKKIQNKFPNIIGKVDGRGLFLSMEMVKDLKSKEPMSKEMMNLLFSECMKRGMLSMSYAPAIRLQPALTITEEVALEGLDLSLIHI